jgi:folate-dependent tRNA-U54 methylase TrmFO/GidA
VPNNAVITIYMYRRQFLAAAISADKPTCFNRRLACRAGYEEAAAQGLVAGVNAARVAAGSEVVTFPRENSYLGTLIDDLVTKVGSGRPCAWTLAAKGMTVVDIP